MKAGAGVHRVEELVRRTPTCREEGDAAHREIFVRLAHDFSPASSTSSPLWDLFFHRSRLLLIVQLAYCLFAATWSPSSSSIPRIVLLSTLAEILMWLGHMWLPKPRRMLPFWQLPYLPGIRNVSVMRIVSAFAFLGLAACLVNESLLLPVTCLLLFTSMLDLWRLLYLHYWILALFSISFSSAADLSLSLAIILGCLYFWAGFFKLISPLFHKEIAPWVFAPIFRYVPISWQPILSRLGVFGELCLGLAVFVSPWLTNTALRTLVAVVCGLLHLYIICGIGIANGIGTFICWNAFCASTVSVMLAKQASLPSTWHVWHFVLLLLMNFPPVLQYFGLNDFPTLAHAYFVPTLDEYWLVFEEKFLDRFPAFDNGFRVPLFVRGSSEYARLRKWLPPEGNGPFALLSGSWVDMVMRVGKDDPFNETFGAGPYGFFKAIANEFLPQGAKCFWMHISENGCRIEKIMN